MDLTISATYYFSKHHLHDDLMNVVFFWKYRGNTYHEHVRVLPQEWNTVFDKINKRFDDAKYNHISRIIGLKKLLTRYQRIMLSQNF